MTGPLVGLRVVEVAQYVAGPMATMMLADLGADVVKVETPPKGDAFRTYGLKYGGYSAFWLNVNRGKRSVSLDLKQACDQRRCHELIRRADVVVLTSRPGALDDVGLDDSTLADLAARLIRVHVTGFGPSGPRIREPVFDSLIQGMSGIAAFQTGADGADMEVVAPMVVDKTTALLVAQSILAALYERAVTGNGRRVDVSLLDATAYWDFPDMFQDRTFVADDRRLSRLRSPIIRTSDGHIVLVPVSGRQIALAAEALGHPEWIARLKTIADHTLLVTELLRLAETVTSTMTSADTLELLVRSGVPAGPVHNLDDHLVEPQVVHNQIYTVIDDPELGPIRTVRHPALFDGQTQQAAFTKPAFGDDFDAVGAAWGLQKEVEDV